MVTLPLTYVPETLPTSRQFENEKRPGTEMRSAIASGIVTVKTRRSAIGQFFPCPK